METTYKTGDRILCWVTQGTRHRLLPGIVVGFKGERASVLLRVGNCVLRRRVDSLSIKEGGPVYDQDWDWLERYRRTVAVTPRCIHCSQPYPQFCSRFCNKRCATEYGISLAQTKRWSQEEGQWTEEEGESEFAAVVDVKEREVGV